MSPLPPKLKLFIILVIMGSAICLNLVTLFQAYPETQLIDSGCCAPAGTLLAKDFSAFYFGAWNLYHAPASIYSDGSSANASFLGIFPHPESFKYLPSFLIMISPLLLLSYEQALDAFDVIQFASLFLVAFLIYRLLQGKNVAIIGAVSVVALLLPFSTNPGWGISEAYFWQWAEGQTKVLSLLLILLALYFGRKKEPYLSGIFLGLSFFDPRFPLVSIPLFLALNRGRIVRATAATVLTFLVANLPILSYPGVATAFLKMLFSTGALTPLYYYSFIPLLSIVALSLAYWKEIASAFSCRYALRQEQQHTSPQQRAFS